MEAVERTNDILGTKIQQKFIKIAQEQLAVINRLHVCWGDFLGKHIEFELPSPSKMSPEKQHVMHLMGQMN